MFDRDDIELYGYDALPLDRDVFMMSEDYLAEYERNLVGFLSDENEYVNVGVVSYIALRAIHENTISISWYPNLFDRFHEIRLTIPRAEILVCVSSYTCDEKPRLFVRKEWYEALHRRTFSIFAMIDAIGVKEAIGSNQLSYERLIALRDEIDKLASVHPEVAFISFADTLILKQNFTFGSKPKGSTPYSPEKFISLAAKINDIYVNVMMMNTYAIFTQGGNEYASDDVLHISSDGNHVCLNSLGVPFAHLLAIENEARRNIRADRHPPSEVYMDDHFMNSLKLKHDFKKREEFGRASCPVPMAEDNGCYYFSTRKAVLENLE